VDHMVITPPGGYNQGEMTRAQAAVVPYSAPMPSCQSG
jgi:hypothetical protein